MFTDEDLTQLITLGVMDQIKERADRDCQIIREKVKVEINGWLDENWKLFHLEDRNVAQLKIDQELVPFLRKKYAPLYRDLLKGG